MSQKSPNEDIISMDDIRHLLEELEKNKNSDEIELKEDLSVEDEQLYEQIKSGRRTAHTTSAVALEAPLAPEPPNSDAVKDKIIERSVSRKAILEKDRQTSSRIIMSEIERSLMIGKSALKPRDDSGIYPPQPGK